jgi:hypothetical protein
MARIAGALNVAGTQKVVRVFVSSTWQDLQGERAAVEHVLNRMNESGILGMEYFGSRPETPRIVSLAEIASSDVYVGIFGNRYGSGIVEAEYRRARERGLPCLIYIRDDALTRPGTYAGESSEEVDRLGALLRELRDAHVVTLFSSPDDLAAKVATDLYRVLAEFQPRQTASLLPQERDNRWRMLARVDAMVGSQLEAALQSIPRLTLPLNYRLEAVPNRPYLEVLEDTRSTVATLPLRTVVEAFDVSDGELLIVGAPGVGKTTTLLDLARVLIRRAQADEALPIPIVFRLASWGMNPLPLAEWLIAELTSPGYDVPATVARNWVTSDQILPLLDGLDEVAGEHRVACVAAINAFRAERGHRLTQIAVSCRINEYEALPQLRLRGAILVQPLADEQVDAYLADMGEEVAGLREALRQDDELRELARTPLLLNLMILTYRGAPATAPPAQGSLYDRRTVLMVEYVRRMFERRATMETYPRERTVHWLAWLGQSLSQHSQAIFHLESLQVDWLPTPATRRRHAILRGLISGLTFGLAFGLAFGLMFGALVGLPLGLSVGLVVGQLFNLIYGSGYSTSLEVIRWSWSQVRRGFMSAVLFGLVLGLALGLAFGLLGGIPLGLIFGLVGALVTGLIAALLGGLVSSEISIRASPNEGIHRSARRAVVLGLVGGLVGGTILDFFQGR